MKIALRSAKGPKRGRTTTESRRMKCLRGKVESPNLVKLISCKAKDIGKPQPFVQKHLDKTMPMKKKNDHKRGQQTHGVHLLHLTVKI